MFTRLLLLLILFGVLGHGGVAQAHDSRPAYLELNETAPGRYEVLWRTPLNAGMRLPVALKFPDDTRNITAPSLKEFTGMLLERRWIDAGNDRPCRQTHRIRGPAGDHHRRPGAGAGA